MPNQLHPSKTRICFAEARTTLATLKKISARRRVSVSSLLVCAVENYLAKIEQKKNSSQITGHKN